jgi:3',5'-cyclic AMP phosphodiesterase CpdA
MPATAHACIVAAGTVATVAATVLGILLIGGAAARADFSFVHITDTHFTQSTAAGSAADKNRALLREISALTPRPAFVINTGDVTELGRPAEFAAFRATLAESLTIPHYAAPGNHDVRWSPLGKEGYPREARQPRYQSWNRDGVHFVLLDSTTTLQHWGHFDQAMLDWLEGDSAAGRRAHAHRDRVSPLGRARNCSD